MLSNGLMARCLGKQVLIGFVIRACPNLWMISGRSFLLGLRLCMISIRVWGLVEVDWNWLWIIMSP